MITLFHVYQSDDDQFNEGGTFEHAKTFDNAVPGWRAEMFEFAGRLLNERKAVQILPESVDG